jgi:hypothetical protein
LAGGAEKEKTEKVTVRRGGAEEEKEWRGKRKQRQEKRDPSTAVC